MSRIGYSQDVLREHDLNFTITANSLLVQYYQLQATYSLALTEALCWEIHLMLLT